MDSTWDIKMGKKRPKLSSDTEADVVVVGGGLTGVWCAYLLARSGLRVVVLEKGRLGRSETLYTTAFITQVIDTSLVNLEKMFGSRVARGVWRSGGDAISMITQVVENEEIKCEFERIPFVLYARSRGEYNKLRDEQALAEILGFDHVSLKQPYPTGFKNYGALEVVDQAKYHPTKFLNALVEVSERLGVIFHEDTEVVENEDPGSNEVRTKDGYLVEADHVIIATYDPLGNPQPTRFKKGMYTSYVYELEIHEDSIASGMYADLNNPYHYMRVDKIGRGKGRLLLGGEDHRVELKMPEDKGFRALESYMQEIAPKLEYKVVNRWKGGILESSDGLPLIGETRKCRYVACAFSGNGMTYAPLAGMILRNLIVSGSSEYGDIYDPKRRLRPRAVARKALDYTGELFGGAVRNLFR
jgi:glycine/D-amino acid oxidase-like deaminating enzyme